MRAVNARSSAPQFTTMQWAFLNALLRWAARKSRSSGLVALPVERADADELLHVLIAIVCAGIERDPRGSR
jgi:hypothetical protein